MRPTLRLESPRRISPRFLDCRWRTPRALHARPLLPSFTLNISNAYRSMQLVVRGLDGRTSLLDVAARLTVNDLSKQIKVINRLSYVNSLCLKQS